MPRTSDVAVWVCHSAAGTGRADRALALSILRSSVQVWQIGRDAAARVAQLPGLDAARRFGVDAGGATHDGRLEPGGIGVGREAAGQGGAQAGLKPQ